MIKSGWPFNGRPGTTALSKVFCGKSIEGLKSHYDQGKLIIPHDLTGLHQSSGFERWVDHLVARDWVVYCKRPFAGPKKVVRYVGRYTHRVAISNQRIMSIGEDRFSFSIRITKPVHIA